ncbi:MAG: glycosyltransferase family 39 protein, partial [Myxococcales bacterium]|nr:glycosyltransferase family 39 protein [Myxococcales bacterium]
MAALFLFDAYEGHVPRAPLVALIPIFGVIAAVFYRVGRPPADAAVVDGLPGFWNAQPGESPYLAPRYTIPAALAVALVGALTLGYPSFEWVAVASLVVLLPSAVRRPGLLLFVVVSAAYLPRLGGYGLWDPWETHYGEVSREILARKDWISLWWAQEYWFWSKPILIFWMEATSMASLGVNFLPDANPENAEWALRLPHYLLSMGAVMSVFALVRRTFSVRAGFLAGLALATIPHFFFLAHQAITDMPFVSTM